MGGAPAAGPRCGEGAGDWVLRIGRLGAEGWVTWGLPHAPGGTQVQHGGALGSGEQLNQLGHPVCQAARLST